jgi:WD40 repeat protein
MLWAFADGKPLQRMRGDNRDNVKTVAFRSDGKLIASGGNKDRKIRLWSAPDGQQLPSLEGHAKEVNCLAFSPDGRILASGSDDFSVFLWVDREAQ